MNTSTQALQALKKANSTRSAMSAVKRHLRTGGRIRAANMLRDPEEAVKRMRVNVFLCAINRVSQNRAIEILKDAGLPTSSLTWRIGPLYEHWTDANVRTLTSRQRACLVAVLAKPSHHGDSDHPPHRA